MKNVKFYDNEQVDLTEISATQALALQNIQELVAKVFYTGDVTISGMAVRASSVPDGNAEIPEGLTLQSGALIEIPTGSKEVAHVIGNVGTGWGTGQAAHATLPRYSIVCIKYAQKATDLATKTFYDPGSSSQYSASVNTRNSDYYDIQVVHGTPASSPAVPATPTGYIKLAEIFVPANATTVTSGNITNKQPATVKTVTQTNSDLANHIAQVTGAHAASAISVADSGGYFASTKNAEAILQEIGNILSSWLNQSVKTTAAPTFAGMTSTGDVTLNKNDSRVVLNRPSGQTGQYAGFHVNDNGVAKGRLFWDFTNNKFVLSNNGGSSYLDLIHSGGSQTIGGTLATTGAITEAGTALSAKYVSVATSISAGSGLTGGGTLVASRTIDIAASGVTDTHIGNRTINDGTAQTAGVAASLTTLLSQLANMVKAMTGKANWYTAPAITLETVNTLFGAGGHNHNGAAGNGPKITSGGLANDAATDTIIGNRTIADSTAQTAGAAATLTTLLGQLGNMVKAMTGKANWYTAPAITLETVAGYLDQAVKTGSSPTFAAATLNGNLTLKTSGNTTRYILTDGTAAATGAVVMQAGSGSAGMGGAINLFAHAHTTKPGWVVAGISSSSGGKFAVNDQALGGGLDVFTVSASGAAFTGPVSFASRPSVKFNTPALDLIDTATGGANTVGSEGVRLTLGNTKYAYLSTVNAAGTWQRDLAYWDRASGEMFLNYDLTVSGKIKTLANAWVGFSAADSPGTWLLYASDLTHGAYTKNNTLDDGTGLAHFSKQVSVANGQSFVGTKTNGEKHILAAVGSDDNLYLGSSSLPTYIQGTDIYMAGGWRAWHAGNFTATSYFYSYAWDSTLSYVDITGLLAWQAVRISGSVASYDGAGRGEWIVVRKGDGNVVVYPIIASTSDHGYMPTLSVEWSATGNKLRIKHPSHAGSTGGSYFFIESSQRNLTIAGGARS